MNKIPNIVYVLLFSLSLILSFTLVFLLHTHLFDLKDLFLDVNFNDYMVSDSITSDSHAEYSTHNKDFNNINKGKRPYTREDYYKDMYKPEINKHNFRFNSFKDIARNVQECQNILKSKIKITVYKFKLYDETLSWFFSDSKPGGGRRN